jgi:hypothetical protein
MIQNHNFISEMLAGKGVIKVFSIIVSALAMILAIASLTNHD